MNKNRIVVPEAKDAMNKFKMEVANEVGITLKHGYNGDLTSKQAGSIGGLIPKKMTITRNMSFKRNCRRLDGHEKVFTYRFCLTV